MSERLGLPDLHGRLGLLCAVLIDNLGSGIFLPFAVLCATALAHISIAMTGLILSLCAACALPAAPIAGALADRFGAQRVVVAAQLLLAMGFAGYLFISTPLTLFACDFAVAVGSQAYFATNGAFVARLSPPDQRARWFALLGACHSAGLGVGAALSALMLTLASSAGYRLLAVANALSFLVAAYLIARVTMPPIEATNSERDSHPSARVRRGVRFLRAWRTSKVLGGYQLVLRDGPFLGFTATNVGFSLIVLSFSVVLPVYLVGPLRLPLWTPGAVFGMNTALVVVAQTTIARWCERYRRTQALAFSAGLFALALVLLSRLANLPRGVAIGLDGWRLSGLVAATVVYTAAVLVMAPQKNALVADAAPDALRGRYLAFYHLSWSVASTIGPAALTALLAIGSDWVWLSLTGVAFIVLLALWRLDSALLPYAVRATRQKPLSTS
ncbi:MAG TPA: MFS transporter [Ktedonobacterales bacterium]|nr:MFS transporter [Ktedonobacterales bacterium]